ncbi:cupredoxin domain-containing protein [Streptomyces flavalbus]|uniref:Cupredoxin domain-containing protein n=1 Tax=Streptomyces flavalbus TaxID=2665155 RepID=A0ABW2WK89_9ACTN
MTGKPLDLAPPPARGGGFGPTGVKARHLRAHVLVVAWLALALVAALAQPHLPIARWLAVHLFLLGAATTALVIWSEHFATALLHAPYPDARWSTARLAAVNTAVAGLLTGVWADLPVLTGAACALLVAAVTAHLVVLARMGRGALGGRLAPVVGFYRAATVALLGGAVLGWLLASGHAGTGTYAGLRLAHVHLTLLGWIGLPVLGTLFMLWPTVLGVRMAEHTPRVVRRVLVLTGAGLLVAVVALAVGWRWAAVAGIAGYAAGLAVAVDLFARTLRGRDPVSAAAAWTLAASVGWLCVGVVADAGVLAAQPLAEAQDGVGDLVPALLVGFVAQVLIGALTQLLPVVLGSGPQDRGPLRAVLERGWPLRLTALNAGVALLVLPGPFGPAGLVLAAVAGGAFVALTATVLVRAARGAGRSATATATRLPVLLGTAAGAVLTVLAVVVANSGGVGGTPSVAAGAGHGGTTATRTVEVTLAAMRVRPSRVEVTAGTALRLKVSNDDAQRHDLKVEDGPGTPLLSRGQSRTLDLGPVTADRQAWCTLPGHRAAGMTLDIVVKDDGGGSAGHADGHAAMADSGTGPDLAADFTGGWRPATRNSPPRPAAPSTASPCAPRTPTSRSRPASPSRCGPSAAPHPAPPCAAGSGTCSR